MVLGFSGFRKSRGLLAGAMRTGRRGPGGARLEVRALVFYGFMVSWF